MNLRLIGFRVISKLKSSPVERYIKEFKLSKNIKEKLMFKRLNNILNIAFNQTQFYRNYHTFEELPIISKEVLRERYDEFISDQMDKDNALVTTTSGSSGQPMTFYLSKNKKYRQNAEVIFYNSWANIHVGDKHGYVRVTKLKSKLKLFLQNEVLMNPKNLTDEWLEEQVHILKTKKISSLIGYPSAIAAIAQKSIQLKNQPDNFYLNGIITSGENLKEKDITAIKKAFGVAPISRYSTEEFGVIATMCPKCDAYHLNDTGYFIEILEVNSNKHVKLGEMGRIVVTDLFNDYMPLIRFDTGDLAIYGGESNCSHYPTGKVIKSIIGRQIETVYDVEGKPISPFAINGALRDFNSIKRFQFIQNDLYNNDLLIVSNNQYSIEDEKIIQARFQSILGVQPNIKIVNEIKPLKSGKRPYIINKYINN